MERGAGGGHPHHQFAGAASNVAAAAAAGASHGQYEYMTELEHANSVSFDNSAIKKKPPKLKAIHRSMSMAIDNYAPPPAGASIGAAGGELMMDHSLIVEQPLIHRSASPLPMRATPPPQTLTLPTAHYQQHGGGISGGVGGTSSGAVSPAMSTRQKH